MSDYDDPGFTGADQADVEHFETGQDHSAMEQLHTGHGAETDFGQQFGVFEHDHAQSETTELEQGRHIEYSAGYDEGEQPAFTGGDIDDLHSRLGGLGGDDEPGASAGLGVADR